MRRFGLLLFAGALSVAGVVSAGGYGSCCDPCCDPCCQPCCDPCCDPCCQPCCDPCWDCCSDCGFEIIGEYLYIRPHQCDLNYVIVDDREYGDTQQVPPVVVAGDGFLPEGKKLGVCPDYESAFRVGVGFLFNGGCNDITVTYTRLCTRDRSHVAASPNGGLWITNSHPRYVGERLNNANIVPVINGGTINTFPQDPTYNGPVGLDARASSTVRNEYNMVDGTIGMRKWAGCNLWVRGFVGLRWADICVRQQNDYEGTATVFGAVTDGVTTQFARLFFPETVLVRRKTDTWGIGPRIGADLRYEIACNFGIGAHVGASILAGEACQTVRQDIMKPISVFVSNPAIVPLDNGSSPPPVPNEVLDVRSSSRCQLFPEIDARLGLNYLWCCGDCFSLLVEVGWEFVSYINAIGRVRFNHIGGTNREICESWNLDGLYVSFKLMM